MAYALTNRLPIGPQSEARRLAIAEGDYDFDRPESWVYLSELPGSVAATSPADFRFRLPASLAALAPGPNASAAKHQQFRRDVVMYLAHACNGFSQRCLSEVFGLARARVAAIVAKFDMAVSQARSQDA